MIRVLYLPLNYGSVVQNGVYDAFREAGCHLDVFDYFYEYERHGKRVHKVREDLIKRAFNTKPDMVYMQIQHTKVIDAKTISTIKQQHPKTIIVNWTGDIRNYIPPTYKSMSHVSDYNLISSTGQLDQFRKECNNVYYLQIGYNPKLYFPNENHVGIFDYDVSFVANNNVKENYPGRHEREEVCRILRKEFGNRFGLFGHGWPRSFASKGSIDQSAVNSIYHNSYCVLSVSHFNDVNHYFSDRLLMCLASGRPTISYRFPKWQSYFTHDSDIVIADSISEIPNKVRELLSDPAKANFIGESGAAKVYAEHTYLSRINELLHMVGLK